MEACNRWNVVPHIHEKNETIYLENCTIIRELYPEKIFT